MPGNGLQDSHLSFDELYEQARQAMPQLETAGEKILSDLRQKHPGLFQDAYFELGPIKEVDRAQAKIQGDYGGDQAMISDLARGRIVVDKPEEIQAIRDYLAEHAQTLGIEKNKDRFAEPSDTHFRDINMKARMENGHVVELRIEQKDLLQAAKKTHDPYEDAQAIERRAQMENRLMTDEEAAQRQKLMNQVHDIHDEASNKAGLNGLLNQKGEAKLADHAQKRAQQDIAHATGLSITKELGKRAGVIGALVTGGALAASGASADEIALSTAEAAIPGVASAEALTEGRVVEAGLRGIKEVPFGVVATEVIRPAARIAGLDVDPSLGQMALSALPVRTPEEERLQQENKKFNQVYDRLPSQVSPGMPPEVELLVIAKNTIETSEEKLSGMINGGRTVDQAELTKARQSRSRAEELYAEQYHALKQSDALPMVTNWLDTHPGTPAAGQQQNYAYAMPRDILPAAQMHNKR